MGRRTSPLWAGSLPTSAHGALRDRWPHPVDPREPSGGPGTIPVTPETFPMAETGLFMSGEIGLLDHLWGQSPFSVRRGAEDARRADRGDTRNDFTQLRAARM